MAKGGKIKPSSRPLNFAKDRDKLSSTKKKQWIEKAVELLKEGQSSASIRAYIAENKEGSTSDETLLAIISEANAIINNEYFIKNEQVTGIHVARYNSQIKQLISTEELSQELIDSEEEGGISYETWMRSRQKKEKAYFTCIDTMIQKETLQQYHNKDFVDKVTITYLENIEIKVTKPKWDISDLSVDDLSFMNKCIQKCKGNENDLISVSEAIREDKQVTVDVEHEVIEEANIEQIKQEELPPAPYVSPVTHFNPTAKLKEALIKARLKELQGIGAKLNDKEKTYLEKE